MVCFTLALLCDLNAIEAIWQKDVSYLNASVEKQTCTSCVTRPPTVPYVLL